MSSIDVLTPAARARLVEVCRAANTLVQGCGETLHAQDYEDDRLIVSANMLAVGIWLKQPDGDDITVLSARRDGPTWIAVAFRDGAWSTWLTTVAAHDGAGSIVEERRAEARAAAERRKREPFLPIDDDALFPDVVSDLAGVA